MPVRSPVPTETRSRLADWLEVMCLANARGVATRGDLLGLYDLLGEDDHRLERDDQTGEDLEGEILEDARTESADVVLDELEHRAKVLRGYYPFVIEIRGQSWRIVAAPADSDAEAAAARSCYVFCLLTSAIRDRCIQGAGVPPLVQTMPNHFQAIAAEAAAGVMGGQSISFGWPRPAGTGFRPALADVSKRMRLGKPLDAVPLWSSGREKDAGIDVIAWRDFDDQRPGKLVLFGQVASGNDWTEKTVKTDTPHFLSWFTERPTEHYIPAIFIPFPQHHACAGRKNAGFEAVAASEAWLREQEFGLVIDRLRIVGVAARQLVDAKGAANEDVLNNVGAWIADALVVARAAA
jgi:hypothetical protein